MIGLLGLIILIILLAIVLIRQNRLRNNHRTLLFQQRLLRTQMNPHFLFNSLTSIQHYIINKDPTLASDYLGRFSKLVRQILNNSAQEYILLEDEISSIKNYLELQKLRFHNMFDYSIEIGEMIDEESVLVPPMLAQPFIENAIEHGFKNKEDKGHLKISFRLNGNMIRVIIDDNGVGRKKAQKISEEQNRGHRSMSTTITRERLQVLKRRAHSKIHLEISDLKDENENVTGTSVIFDMPYKD
jgi:sensor histidine kinase YesM